MSNFGSSPTNLILVKDPETGFYKSVQTTPRKVIYSNKGYFYLYQEGKYLEEGEQLVIMQVVNE